MRIIADLITKRDRLQNLVGDIVIQVFPEKITVKVRNVKNGVNQDCKSYVRHNKGIIILQNLTCQVVKVMLVGGNVLSLNQGANLT